MAYQTLDDRLGSGKSGDVNSISIEMNKQRNSSSNLNEESPLLESTPRIEVRIVVVYYLHHHIA